MIYNVILISGVQQSDWVIYLSILQILFPLVKNRFLQDIEYNIQDIWYSIQYIEHNMQDIESSSKYYTAGYFFSFLFCVGI